MIVLLQKIKNKIALEEIFFETNVFKSRVNFENWWEFAETWGLDLEIWETIKQVILIISWREISKSVESGILVGMGGSGEG